MPWMDEVLADRAQPIAQAVFVLLDNGPRWRHRRVETITPLSATLVRRRVSVDFSVPLELHDGLRLPVQPGADGEHDQWVVPLGWLSRRPLVNFDLRDGAGKFVPLLLKDQTAEITRDVLLLAAIEGDLDPQDDERADRTVDVVLQAAAAERPADPASLIAKADALELGEDFNGLIALSAYGFLLLAVVSQIEGRQVTKWQTDEFRRRARSGLSRIYVDAQVPGINEASSTHVELELPEALQAATFQLVDRRVVPDPLADGQLRARRVPLPQGERQPSTSEERPRLQLQPVADARDPYVRADILITAVDFLVPALVLVVLAGLTFGVGLGSGIHDLDPADRSTAPSVLLGAFSVGFGLFLRVESNALVRAMLAQSRAALGATAAALAVAALPLALRLARGWVLGAWIVAAGVTFIAALAIGLTIINFTKFGREHG